MHRAAVQNQEGGHKASLVHLIVGTPLEVLVENHPGRAVAARQSPGESYWQVHHIRLGWGAVSLAVQKVVEAVVADLVVVVAVAHRNCHSAWLHNCHSASRVEVLMVVLETVVEAGAECSAVHYVCGLELRALVQPRHHGAPPCRLSCMRIEPISPCSSSIGHSCSRSQHPRLQSRQMI